MDLYHTLEVEVTNVCNANCIFCGNSSITRERGFISPELFKEYIHRQAERLGDNFFFQKNVKGYPKVNFCGLGDPVLHPKLENMISEAKKAGFYTQIVTNGIALTGARIRNLCENGLDEVCISLHSVNAMHYKSITGVDLAPVLNNTVEAINECRKHYVKVCLWRIHNTDEKERDTQEDETRYSAFLKVNGFDDITVLGPSEPWYRDGVVPNAHCEKVRDLPIWCNKVLFTDFIDWHGNVVLCCNDYNRETVILGNVFDEKYSYDDIKKKKVDIVKRLIRPGICEKCRRWPDTEVLTILENSKIEYSELERAINNYIGGITSE